MINKGRYLFFNLFCFRGHLRDPKIFRFILGFILAIGYRLPIGFRIILLSRFNFRLGERRINVIWEMDYRKNYRKETTSKHYVS